MKTLKFLKVNTSLSKMANRYIGHIQEAFQLEDEGKFSIWKLPFGMSKGELNHLIDLYGSRGKDFEFVIEN